MHQKQLRKFYKRHFQAIPFEKYGKFNIISVFMAGSTWKKVQMKYVLDEMDTFFTKLLSLMEK